MTEQIKQDAYNIFLLAGVIGLLWATITIVAARRFTNQVKAKDAIENAELAKRAIEQKIIESIAAKTAKINQVAQAEINSVNRGYFVNDD